MNALSRAAHRVARRINMRMLVGLLFMPDGYLRKTGWLKSVVRMQAVDQRGDPIPWLAYPFIEFIQPKLQKTHKVFEYGSGNSTRWFARFVQHITSIEHDADWYKTLKDSMPANARLIYAQLPFEATYAESSFKQVQQDTDYVAAIRNEGAQYDIIIIDGVMRNNCVVSALDCLTPGGVIIIDNLEFKEELKEGVDFLTKNGFRTLEFNGLSPISFLKTCTGIFYRPDNCLNI